MSILAKIFVDQEERVLNEVHYSFIKPLDYLEQPWGDVQGGIINLEFECTQNDSLWRDWSIAPFHMKKGYIRFYRRDTMAKFYDIEFWDCYCLGFHESFYANGPQPMTIKLKLSAGILRIRGLVYEKAWKVSDPFRVKTITSFVNESHANEEKEIPYKRLLLWGGARNPSHNNTFERAKIKVRKDYSEPANVFVDKNIHSGREIVDIINKQKDDSIQSLDIFSHGSPEGIEAGNPDYPRPLGNSGLFKDQASMPNFITGIGGDSATIDEINFSKFRNASKVEFHGCKTSGGDKANNFAASFSKRLFEASKTNAVVIGHSTGSGPDINGKDKTTDEDQDYRFGTRIVYHNGIELFRTNQRGRITATEINKRLSSK